MKVGISPQARLDLLDIQEHIAQDNPWRARTFVEEIIAKIESVGTRPLSFPILHDAFPDHRVARHGRYLIVFMVFDDEVSIDRVVHGARDIPSLLAGG